MEIEIHQRYCFGFCRIFDHFEAQEKKGGGGYNLCFTSVRENIDCLSNRSETLGIMRMKTQCLSSLLFKLYFVCFYVFCEIFSLIAIIAFITQSISFVILFLFESDMVFFYILS